jgi:hypothetical protein
LRLALVALCLTAAGPTRAEDARSIIDKSIEQRQVRNSIQTVTMVIEDIKRDGSVRAGKPRTLLMKIRDDDDAVRSYIRFMAPADLDGVQFVSISPERGETEQFMYYPPPDQLFTRISGSGKAGRFFGSDFSYEDLEIADAGEATHTILAEESLSVAGQSLRCWKIQSTPGAGSDSSYSKLVTWVDQATYLPRRVLFFDKKGRELKRMTIEKVVRDGELWVPIDTLMEGLQRTTRTRLHVEKYRTNVPESELPLETFTEAFLKSQG